MTATIQEIFGDYAIYDRENNTVTIDLKNFELTQENAEKLLAAIIVRNEKRKYQQINKVTVQRPFVGVSLVKRGDEKCFKYDYTVSIFATATEAVETPNLDLIT